MIDSIIDKILEMLKQDERLDSVKEWHKINGLVPEPVPTISVGCDEESYEEDTRSHDRVTAQIKIYASLDNRNLSKDNRQSEEHRLAYGERCLHSLAAIIRHTLCQDHTLEGVADTSFVNKIDYVTADEHKDLHIAVISFEVIFYAPRLKPPNGVKVETLGMDIEIQGRE